MDIHYGDIKLYLVSVTKTQIVTFTIRYHKIQYKVMSNYVLLPTNL